MSEQEFNLLFAKNLKYYLIKNNMNQQDLANKLGVSTTSVSNWCMGTKTPRMDKVDAICKLFEIRRSDLMEDHLSNGNTEYYLDPETKKKAQEIFENKELSLLFDAARDASPEDIQTIHTMLLALKNKEKR